MDYKEQKLKEFSEHIFNKTFSRDGKIYWGEVEDFLRKSLEEQENKLLNQFEQDNLETVRRMDIEHGQQIAYLNNMLRKQEKEIETLKGHLDVSKIIEKKYSDCCNYEIYEKPNSWKEYCSSCNESCDQRKD